MSKLDESTEKRQILIKEYKSKAGNALKQVQLPLEFKGDFVNYLIKLDQTVLYTLDRSRALRDLYLNIVKLILALYSTLPNEDIETAFFPKTIEEVSVLGYLDPLIEDIVREPLTTLVQLEHFRLFRVISNIHPMLRHTTIDDGKYAEAVELVHKNFKDLYDPARIILETLKEMNIFDHLETDIPETQSSTDSE
jgi:hypothetical protein